MPNFPLYWIYEVSDGRLAVTPAPNLETLRPTVWYWKEEGVDIVVCLLEASEIPGLVKEENYLCEEMGLEFLWFPLKDGSVPVSGDPFDGLIEKLTEAITQGKSVAIHCRAGIGRAPVVATALLCRLGIKPVEALDMVVKARRAKVPQTEEQRQWILTYLDCTVAST